jgi:hypothetical protein
MLRLVTASGVGVVVDPGVARQLIGAAEALRASGELACVRLFTRMGADVSGLVFQAVEGTVTEGALVRARKILADFFVGGARSFHERWEEAHR